MIIFLFIPYHPSSCSFITIIVDTSSITNHNSNNNENNKTEQGSGTALCPADLDLPHVRVVGFLVFLGAVVPRGVMCGGDEGRDNADYPEWEEYCVWEDNESQYMLYGLKE